MTKVTVIGDAKLCGIREIAVQSVPKPKIKNLCTLEMFLTQKS